MLMLIAGITGMCGQPCARTALSWGHQVRGMGRNPEKLDKDIKDKLESFVQIKGMLDTDGLDRSVKGVDAIICAYNNMPELIVAGQLALLYAAEKAGVRIFHAASWTYDWTKLQLGDHENYDAFIAFKRTVEISSTIRPIYGFTGGILEYGWCHNLSFRPVDTDEHAVSYFGDGNVEIIWITVENLAQYSVAAVTDANAAQGMVYHVESFRASYPEVGRIYGDARGIVVQNRCLGDQKILESMLNEARETTPANNWEKYIGLAYGALCNSGKMGWEESVDSRRWADKVKQTGLKSWLEQNPKV